jgi:hypothetical protein
LSLKGLSLLKEQSSVPLSKIGLLSTLLAVQALLAL